MNSTKAKSPKAKKQLPLYVWLIAMYPILFLYSRNVGDVYAWQMWQSLGLSILGAALIFGVAWVITRSLAKAGAIATMLVLAFFTYGHAYNLLIAERPDLSPILIAGYAIVIVLFIYAIMRFGRNPMLERIIPALNFVAGALLVMAIVPIAMYWGRGTMQSVRAAASETIPGMPAHRVMDSASHPDIYYIILDAYSSNAFNLHDYGYDNSAFTDALEERGFYVAYDSHTAYAITVPSKFSTLNMRYITTDDEAAAKQEKSDIQYLRQGIADNAAARALQDRGYTYVFLLSGYDVPSKIADVNVDFHPSGPVYFEAGQTSAAGSYNPALYYQLPFMPLLLETTALRSYAQQAEETSSPIGDQPYDFREPKRALAVWDEAETITERPEATFTVIHIIKPHEPVTFDREGNILPYANSANSSPERLQRRFFEQLEFVNARTLDMLDTIIAESDVPPIIILQGDHGSHLGSPRSEDKHRTNFGILSTYRFPGRECEGLTQDIIPVNSFRVLLNCYFDAGLPMLEPHYYNLPIGYEKLFWHKEIDIDEWKAEHEGK